MPRSRTTIRHSLLLLLLFAVTVCAQTPDADRILGRWDTGKNEALFEFYQYGTQYQARMIPLKYPDCRDSHNPVDSLRSRPLLNLVLVRGLIYREQSGSWSGGTIYNPEDGRTYSCECTIAKDGSKMKFRGYIGISLLGGSRVFSRVDDNGKKGMQP